MGYSNTLMDKDRQRSLKELEEVNSCETVICFQRIMRIDRLKEHPNYKDLTPIKGESLVAFTLRYAANLVSPPQYEGESYEVECTTIKDGILSLEEEIEAAFKNFK